MSQFEVNRDALVAYLEYTGCDYDVNIDDEDRYLAQLEAELDNDLERIVLLVSADEISIRCIGKPLVFAESTMYDKVIEYLTRVNYGHALGTFELDYTDGEIDYSYALLSIAGVSSRANIEDTVLLPARMLNRYGDGLLKVISGAGEPAAEVQLANNKEL